MKVGSERHGMLLRLMAAILLVLVLAGCAAGNSYSYRESEIAIPVSGDGSIGLAVVDRRPYVLSGDKPAAFIGLQRGGFGNPFNVTTASGRPLAEEVQSALASGLGKRGFKVIELYPASGDELDIFNAIESGNLSENVVLVLREWKTDAMMSFGLSYDLVLQVLGPDGSTLATSSTQGTKENLGPAGFEEQNSLLAKRALESKIQALFREASVQEAFSAN